jgi:methylation protein EvaC
MYSCLICESRIVPFISFGNMPLANGFLMPEDFSSEAFSPLEVGFCRRCLMVQLTQLVDRDKMFHADYPFFSSTSRGMVHHFQQFADEVMMDRIVGARDPFVVEIGSNDGIMLQQFMKRGVRHLGIEPSANVARIAKEKGVRTLTRYFDEELALDIREQEGKADVILAANVMCHIPYLHSIAAGIGQLLKSDGLLIFEDPYLGDIIAKTSFDQIYDEHALYFSASSLKFLFDQYDLELIDLVPQKIHGGSMRYVFARRGRAIPQPAVAAFMDAEITMGLTRWDTFDGFRQRVEGVRDHLKQFLVDLRSDGKRIAGYAATSKSTTVTNYCGIGPQLVEYIADSTPLKQGRFSPGTHIPIHPPERFRSDPPDLALLFGWNHAEEILSNEKWFQDRGGEWILYVPEVHIRSGTQN